MPEPIYRPESDPSPIDNDMFQSLEAVAKRMYPEATVIPSMSTGATDMAQVRSMGVPSYGIGPVRSIEEMNSGRGAHGDNERCVRGSDETTRAIPLVHDHRYSSNRVRQHYSSEDSSPNQLRRKANCALLTSMSADS